MSIWVDRWCQLFGYADCKGSSPLETAQIAGTTLAACLLCLMIVSIMLAQVRSNA